MRTIAALSKDKFGDTGLWEQLIQAIVAGAAARDLGEVGRSDRSILSLSTSPLPDGATLVTFNDVTDRFRIETALRDRNEGLEAADRLKSDFIKHVSYELRTPPNTILGFSEHLASGVPGALNAQQSEYVQAIVQGGNNTVQTYIWSQYQQIGLSPKTYALMTLLIAATLALLALLAFLDWRRRSRD